MDQEAFLTPRKIFQNAFNAARKSTTGVNSPSVKAYTPTTLSRTAAGTSRINLLPVIQTPPSRMVKGKVINPFEAHLTDRLHLPVICSPSLFQRPSTPQSGSVTQFEWTIDEVSYLGPANVEAHETQFMETPDPVLEAKAQAAISAYFKDHSIVPSPIDCQLRQKIVLNGESTAIDSFMGRKSKRKRDGIAQTVLTFPPILPKKVEDLLAPYFGFHDNQQQTHESINESDVSIDHEARDASLRRKLFNCSATSTPSEVDRDDSLDHLDMHSLSPAPVTPEVVDKESVQNLKRSRCFGSQEITIDPHDDLSLSPVVDVKEKESFGALSPISKSSTSPSPLKPGVGNSTELPDHDAIYRSTPERSKSAVLLVMNCSANSHHMSVDQGEKHTDLTVDFNEEDLSYEETPLASSQSSSSVSQHPTTPLRPRERRRNRKNLSRSFLLYSDEDRFEEEQELEQQQKQLSKESHHHRSFAAISDKENIPNAATTSGRYLAKSVPETSSGTFYRMDSGFNEEETRASQETADYETDVSMQSECCGDGDGRLTPQGMDVTRWKMSSMTNSDGQHHTGCSIRL